MSIRLLLVLAVASIAACSRADTPPSADEGDVSDAKAMADRLTGDAQGAAADNPLCQLFTPEELAEYIGEPLGDGENAAMGSGCIWYSEDEEGDVLIQVAPKDYHSNPDLAEGYKALPDIGEEGNVSPAMGGWIASAIVGEETVVASVSGQTADAAQAEALLRETIARRSR